MYLPWAYLNELVAQEVLNGNWTAKDEAAFSTNESKEKEDTLNSPAETSAAHSKTNTS